MTMTMTSRVSALRLSPVEPGDCQLQTIHVTTSRSSMIVIARAESLLRLFCRPC